MSEGGTPRQRALAFLRKHGDARQVLRGRALLGEVPVGDALAALPEPAPQSPPTAWLPTLALCGELEAMRHPRVALACERLAGRLAPDGGFQAEGGEDARLQLTGTLGGQLARCPFVRAGTLAAIGDFLAAHWSPDRVQDVQWENLAAYACYFANAPHEAGDEILQWCGRELERGFRTGAFGAARTAYVLVLCDAHALPGARLPTEELLGALAAEQDADGGFGVPGEPTPDRLERTLEALAAWRHLG
jgi:hypothetical protein